MQNNKGFTLLELLIVITILAIIMLIALPNFSGIRRRMQVRADMTTASLIGKAVRLWYTDYTTDTASYSKLKIEENERNSADYSNEVDNKFLNEEVWVRYTDITGIPEYCDLDYSPASLIDADTNKAEQYQFYVIKIGSIENGRKIQIGITKGETEDSYEDIPDATTVTYDGTMPAIAYIEK